MYVETKRKCQSQDRKAPVCVRRGSPDSPVEALTSMFNIGHHYVTDVTSEYSNL